MAARVRQGWAAFWAPFAPPPPPSPPPPPEEVIPNWQDDLTPAADRWAAFIAADAARREFLDARLEISAIAREHGLHNDEPR